LKGVTKLEQAQNRSFRNSESLFEDAKTWLAGGVASSLRAAMKPTPLFVRSATGSRISDVDGNEYIDYLLGYGPLILGHAHPELTARIGDALANGATYGLQHAGEIALARRLVELLPCAERAALSGSGTEAVMLALRLSRAYTGKTTIVRFHGHYHGWSDSVFTAFPIGVSATKTEDAPMERLTPGTGGQSASALEDIILIPWNDEERLEKTLRALSSDIAAVITEPVMCNSGCIAPRPGYLEKMRALTAELGIVLIFDEVITGFRLGAGGAHERFGVNPDLVTVGKALGGGLAISAVCGRADIMDLIQRGTVSHLGTLNGNAAATAAALAVLDLLTRNEGEAFRTMERTAEALADAVVGAFRKHGVSGTVNRVGPVFHVMFTEKCRVDDFDAFGKRDAAAYAEFTAMLLEEGVLVRPNGLWYVSAVHSDEDVRKTAEAVDAALGRMTRLPSQARSSEPSK
jgi:glutamate-1-semialdehyde 2,1-aminomutase